MQQERKLWFVKYAAGIPVLGICARCNAQFPADPDRIGQLAKAKQSVQEQFDAHTCKPIDRSQDALRIVREATEGNG
jgi:hypothetical protein